MSGQAETTEALNAVLAEYRAQVTVIEGLGCKLLPLGMELPPDLSFEDWQKVGLALATMKRNLAELKHLAKRGLAEAKREGKRNVRSH